MARISGGAEGINPLFDPARTALYWHKRRNMENVFSSFLNPVTFYRQRGNLPPEEIPHKEEHPLGRRRTLVIVPRGARDGNTIVPYDTVYIRGGKSPLMEVRNSDWGDFANSFLRSVLSPDDVVRYSWEPDKSQEKE